jgi:hypothetical protein
VSGYGAVRGCAGVLTAGLVLLGVVLLGAWGAALLAGTPGPGASMLLGHLVAVLAAVGLQRLVDRRGDRLGVAAAFGVFVLVAAVIGVFWWG